MKIFIDSSWFIVYAWQNGKKGDVLLNFYGQYNAQAFQAFVDKILTPAQLYDYVAGDTDKVITLSKKKERLMLDLIPEMRAKK